MKKIVQIFAIATLLILTACDNDNTQSIFADPVDFKINLNAWDNDLRTPGATKVFTAPRAEGRYIGYGGLLVVTSLQYPITPNVYPLFVYDLACPYEARSDVRVEVKELEAICPKCKSTFNIIDGRGERLSGPANSGLQRYNATNDSRNHDIFHITR